jgi:hypothetical protein
MRIDINHETQPIRRARVLEIEHSVAPPRYQSASLADVETLVLVATITILALCIVGSFIYLVRSMVPTV